MGRYVSLPASCHDLGTGCKQAVSDFAMPPRCRDLQWCPALFISCIDVRTLRDQTRDDLVTTQLRGDVQWRPAVGSSGVDVRAFGDEQPGHTGVPASSGLM